MYHQEFPDNRTDVEIPLSEASSSVASEVPKGAAMEKMKKLAQRIYDTTPGINECKPATLVTLTKICRSQAAVINSSVISLQFLYELLQLCFSCNNAMKLPQNCSESLTEIDFCSVPQEALQDSGWH